MKTRIIFLILFIFFVISGCGKKEDEVIKIGVILPLTGDYAVYGLKMKNGIELAIQEFNRNGNQAKKTISVIYEDDQGDPKSSISAFQKIMNENKPSFIIGGATSSTALSLVPVADKENVVLFSPAASSPKLTGASKYFFRNWPSDIYEGKLMGEFVIDSLKINRLAILYVNNDWGVGLSNEFEKIYDTGHGLFSSKESFEPNISNFRTQLTKIKQNNPQALYIIAYIKELLIILRQIEEINLKPQLLGTYALYDPKILGDYGKILEGTIFTAPIFDTSNSEFRIKNFVKNYKDKFSVSPDIWSAQSYDATNILLLAMQNNGFTGTHLNDEIAKIKNFNGITGITSFDQNGDVQKNLRFMIIKDGKFSDYKHKAY